MSFADEWDMFPDCGVLTSAPAKTINNTAFDNEFEEFVKMQKKMRAERQAKEAEEKAKLEAEINATYGYVETAPSEQVAEVAYQAFVEEAEKPKSRKKKKIEEVVEETSEETPVAED